MTYLNENFILSFNLYVKIRMEKKKEKNIEKKNYDFLKYMTIYKYYHFVIYLYTCFRHN